jgi:RecA-family ATPase
MTDIIDPTAPGNGAPPINPTGGGDWRAMTFREWRDRLPYGRWTCADGREVIFNRSYWPILERRPAQQGIPFVITKAMKQELRARGVTDDEIHDMTPAAAHARLGGPFEQAKPANPNEWVDYVAAERFWDDYDDPAGNHVTMDDVNAILTEWGVETLPASPPRPDPAYDERRIYPQRFELKSPDEISPRVNPWLHPFGAATPPSVEVGKAYWDDDEDDEDDDITEAEKAEIAKQIDEMNVRWSTPIPHSSEAAKTLREAGVHIPEPVMPGMHTVKCPNPACSNDTIAVRISPEIPRDGGRVDDPEIEWWCHECGLNRHIVYQRPVAGSDIIPLINMRSWDDEEPPQQEWAVSSRIPVGHTALFSGEGGTGKSLLMLQLAVDVVRGADWFDAPVKRGPALIVDAEDDEKVIHKRLFDILEHHELAFADVRRNLHVASLAGKDAVLAVFDRKSGKMLPTPLYDALLEMAGDVKPVLTGIAASADVFAGDEIDRAQVRQFIAMLTRVAQTAGGAVVLISHPSLSGISSGSGLSGSTAWHNSVRSRFYLKGIKPKKGDDDDADAPDTDLRVIEFRKNNYGPISESVTLRYQNGLFIPAAASTADQAAREAEAEHVFLSVLTKLTYQKQPLSPNNKANNYAPYRIAEQPEAKGFGRAEMKAAMQRLLDAEKIHIDDPGPRSRPSPRLVAGPRKLV